jgi:hypothetical protein
MTEYTKYRATISFVIEINATNEETASYLAVRSVPDHLSSYSSGIDGSGSAKFLSVGAVTLEEVPTIGTKK